MMTVLYKVIVLVGMVAAVAMGELASLDSMLPGSDQSECFLSSPCEPLQTSVCLGASLPYSHTSSALANDSASQAEAMEKLQLWTGLSLVPHCWAVVQPFLCAVYLPQCDRNTSQVLLPSRELCERTREPCRVVETSVGWPDFLQCDQPFYSTGCVNDNAPTLRFNTTGKCEPPLVPTDNPNSWYEGVEGCGLQCQNPLFTPEEHRQVHIFVGIFATLCFICTLFTILSFVIDWKNAARYPALILFFINTCFFLGSIGWLAQFIPGARDDIVCRKDGTIRKAEPQIGSGETASCSVVFILVYYSMMAGITWFVILAYTWYLTFRVLGTTRDAIEGKKGHFHVAAWCIPLVLTIVCLAVTQVDGDSVSGICFVGYMDHAYRGGLVLAPVGGAVVIGLSFLLRGLITLCRIHQESPGLISDRATAKIRETIIRLGIFSTLALAFTLITFSVHVYIFVKEPEWYLAFEDYIVCEAKKSVAAALTNETMVCEMASRPSLVAMEMNLLAFFGAGITMSSWVWNRATRETWKRFGRRIFGIAVNEPVVLQKQPAGRHLNKRRVVRNNKISFSLQSVHDDPLGMKMDLQSVSTNETSMWAVAVPPRFLAGKGPQYHVNSRQRSHSESDVQSIHSYHQTFGHRTSFESRMETSEVDEVIPVRKKKKKKRMKNKVMPLTSSMNSLNHHHHTNHQIFSVHTHTENDQVHPFGVQNDEPSSQAHPFGVQSMENINVCHKDTVRSLRGRRHSDRSLESNPSSCNVQISIERPPSSDHSMGGRFSKRGSASSLEQSSLGGRYVAVNHTTQYSMYSSNVPANMVGLTDIEDPSSCFSTEVEPLPPKCYRTPVRQIFVQPGKDLSPRSSHGSQSGGSLHHSRSPHSGRSRSRYSQSQKSNHSPSRSRSTRSHSAQKNKDDVPAGLRAVTSPPPLSASASWRQPSAPPELDSDWNTQD